MDTKNIITQHSKEKLKVYEEYLKRYLPVMINSPYFDNVRIIEPFAGKGVDKEGNKGSALLAKKVISSFEKDKNYKKIKLYLNDKKEEHYKSLCEYVNSNNFQANIYNKDANEFIIDMFKYGTEKIHSFIFIDPFGYTQINKDTYNLLFSQYNIDILIFIPTYFIYRFLKGEETDPKYKPIAEFLNDFNIKTENAKKSENDTMFAEEIVNSIKKIINFDFVYKRQIKNENNVNSYHLFFITKHIKGADKFLDAIYKIEKDNRDLFSYSGTISDLDMIFENEIRNKGVLDNCELYKLGIKLGFCSPQQQKILRQLEKDNKISIHELTEKKRRQNSFYVNFDNFKKNNKIIEVKYIK